MIATSRPGGPFGGGGQPRRCSFCGRREAAVTHMVRARGSLICDRCVAQAHDAIAAAPPGRRLLRIRPAAGPVADRDAAERAIERAYEIVFGEDLPDEERCRAIESGGNLVDSMRQAAERYPGSEVDVSVEYVRFLSGDEAEVSFVLYLGQPGPSGLVQTGHAVRVDDEWKVSRDTWCRLVAMAGVRCPPPERPQEPEA